MVSNSSSVVISEALLGAFSIQSSIAVTDLSLYTSSQMYYCHATNSQGSISIQDNATSCSESKNHYDLSKEIDISQYA